MRELSGTIGKYEVVKPLGKGAMGMVYLARDTMLERDVALKMMVAGIAADPELKARFEREARAVAKMTHPNVVMVFDLGYHESQPYIAMELLKGDDLQKAMRQPPPMALDRKVTIMVHVLAGLAHAHKAGIIHRDIKPANIFIATDGAVKIMDFGVARLTTASMTGTGSIVGTADYMSPEQVKGAKVDGRSDVFSVGCMLYELVTGRRPFRAENLMAIFYRITHEEPDYTTIPDGPEYAALLPFLKKALSKNLDTRYQSAYEFATELKEYLKANATSESAQHALEELIDIAPPPTTQPPPSTLSASGKAAQQVRAAEAAFRRGDYDGAIRQAQAALKIDSSSAAGLDVLQRSQKGAQALVKFQAAETALTRKEFTVARSEVNAGQQLAPWHAKGPDLITRIQKAEADAKRLADENAATQRATQINALLASAADALGSKKYDEAIALYDQALAMDPSNTAAVTGRTGAVTAKAVSAAAAGAGAAAPSGGGKQFVAGTTEAKSGGPAASGAGPAGFGADPNIQVNSATQRADLPGHLDFDVNPKQVKSGDKYTVTIKLRNEGNAPIQVKDMVVTTTRNGGKSQGAVPPQTRDVAPHQIATLLALPGNFWEAETTSWSMEVFIRTSRGESHRNTLDWR